MCIRDRDRSIKVYSKGSQFARVCNNTKMSMKFKEERPLEPILSPHKTISGDFSLHNILDFFTVIHPFDDKEQQCAEESVIEDSCCLYCEPFCRKSMSCWTYIKVPSRSFKIYSFAFILHHQYRRNKFIGFTTATSNCYASKYLVEVTRISHRITPLSSIKLWFL